MSGVGAALTNSDTLWLICQRVFVRLDRNMGAGQYRASGEVNVCPRADNPLSCLCRLDIKMLFC